MTLVLASQSPRRRVLLGLLVDDFTVQASHVDETFPEGPIPAAMEAVAARKASAVPGDLVLAADTAVIVGNQVLGKPPGAVDARAMLQSLFATGHDVVTALALRRDGDVSTTHVRSHVRFEDVPAQVLDAYIASEEWRGKAGGYGVQDALLAPFVTVEESWSNVVGLPLQQTAALLRATGVVVRDPPSEEDLVARNPF